MMVLSVHDKSIRNLAAAGGVFVVALILGLAVVATRASGAFASTEPETGTLSGAAVSVADANASGGKAVQFGGSVAPAPTTPATPAATDLNDPAKKDIAMQLVSSAENSSLDWKAQYAYIEYNVEGNTAENRGYTAGIIGFTSATGDMLALVKYYTQIAPNNGLAKYVAALEKVNGTSAQTGLGSAFMSAWKAAASDTKFKQAQDYMRDKEYFTPALALAKKDGVVSALGQFAYYDAAVMHGAYDDPNYSPDVYDIRKNALAKAKSPAQGGTEKTYLKAFLDARKAAMLAEAGHSDTTRVDTMQMKFLNENNLALNKPLSWSVYGDPYSIK